MLKKHFAVLLLLFCAIFNVAQASSSAFTLPPQENPEALEKLDVMIENSFRRDHEAFVKLSERHINLAMKLDSIEAAAKKAMNLQYILSAKKNDPRKAITIIDGVLARKYKIKDSFLLGGLYMKRGNANLQLDLRNAIEDYKNALYNFGEEDSLYVADTYLFMGQAYSDLGRFIKAGENFNLAISYFEKLGEYEYMLHAKQGIIVMFSKNGFYERAREEREELIEKLIEIDQTKFLPTIYYNQALDFKNMGYRRLHLEYLFNALERAEKQEEKEYSTLIKINSKLAEYYVEEQNNSEAKKYIVKLNRLIKNVDNDHAALDAYYGATANYYHAVGLWEQALTDVKKRLDIVKNMSLENSRLESLLLLSKIQEGLGDYAESIQSKDAYIALRDSIYSRSNAHALAYYQTLYDTARKEKELVEQSANISLLEKDNESFKKLTFFVSLALVLAFGLILLYRNQRHLRSNKVLQEKYSQELLVSQEEERRRISKDIHDGLGQKLLLIKNKLIASGDGETKEMVDSAIEEVRAVSRDLHPFLLQEMGITRAIEHTLTQIDENTSLFISSEIENIDNIFTSEQEVNIYRIVQESLSNILKHAKAEASKVMVKKRTNNVIIQIIDNGVGFEFSEKLQDIKSLGLKTLLERTKFLNGQMRIHSKKDAGTSLEFQFPTK